MASCSSSGQPLAGGRWPSLWQAALTSVPAASGSSTPLSPDEAELALSPSSETVAVDEPMHGGCLDANSRRRPGARRRYVGRRERTFGPTVAERLRQPSLGKELLSNKLEIDAVPPELRYQLLHRSASAILEAERFSASHAVVLVHSFSSTSRWYEDFATFGRALGAETRRDAIVAAGLGSGVKFHLGWVTEPVAESPSFGAQEGG